MNKRIGYIVGAVLCGVLLAGCGSYNSSHDNAAVNQEVKNGYNVAGIGAGPVTRIDTPGYFPAIVRICTGSEGLYVSESSTGIVTVVPADPQCGAKGVTPANNTVGPRSDEAK